MTCGVCNGVGLSMYRALTHLRGGVGAVGSTGWGTIVSRAKDSAIERSDCTDVETCTCAPLCHGEGDGEEGVGSCGTFIHWNLHASAVNRCRLETNMVSVPGYGRPSLFWTRSTIHCSSRPVM